MNKYKNKGEGHKVKEMARKPSFIDWLAKSDKVVKGYTNQSRKWGNNC